MTNLLLYQRIAQQLAEDIRRGVYQPGERVPSVRKMSSQLNVSHATVLQAYANLEDQGLIRARPQSGYYVHQTPALTAPTPDIARVERPGLVTRSSIIQQVLVESRREGVFPLGAAVPSVDYLPVRALHQQLAKVTRFQSPRAFSYMFSPGFEPLRRQVAIRMRDAGVVVDPSEVVITHGCVDALQMSLRVLTRPGDLIAAESPTYYGLLQLADLLGLKVIEIPSDPATGMSLEALQLAANQWSIKALVLTTRLSNPLGGTMPEERQKQLLRLASDFDIQVVEDDIYGELMFELGRTKALKAYDRLDRVIYCSSFSKTLSPGIRIGWMIAGKYQQEIQRLQMFSTHSACSVTQMGTAAYLENGGYDRHLRYIRQEYRKNLSAFQLAVQQYFPEGTQMTRPTGGFILWVSLPGRVNTQELHVRALQQGISIAPGLIFSNTEQFNHCIRLNCGTPWNREAERALMTLGMLASQLCQETAAGIWPSAVNAAGDMTYTFPAALLICVLSLCNAGAVLAASASEAVPAASSQQTVPAKKAAAAKKAPVAKKAPAKKATPVKKRAPIASKSKSAHEVAKTPLPPAELDLSLPSNMVRHLQPLGTMPQPKNVPLLPPMFAEKPTDNSAFQINGRLLSNEMQLQLRNEERREVEGAALDFQFKQ
eukprot:gene12095-14792_t